ncbi:hypothetical protein BRADI_1g36516v3 [Brachypodium distachyon]|uniref:Endonuclease/exonuclease/phosphatase domain-containing protein n=1 Tax=Brachypodium distachyon TaxID=15368 RepID=A0A2K2DN19_BRADI|nr:hypothetical protein BRADI_1g36516v3 [Brachypodium distachyon]
MGDFNDMMYTCDKSNINDVNRSRMRSFCNYVKNCGLIDLGYSGPAYTWSNRRYSSTPLYERLDRFFANPKWSDMFPNANVYNLPIMLSDHAPVLAMLHSKYK